MTVADTTKTLFRRAGVEVTRYRPVERRRQTLIEAAGVRSVLDVGANTGQYASELRRWGFDGHVLSFEPLPDAFAELRAATASDPRWSAVNVAASDSAGRASLNVAGNSASSSLLTMAATHERAAPGAATVGVTDVALARLDEVDEVRGLPDPLMLKLDVQGHELSALRGATGVLDRVALIEAELSVRELYDGAPLMREVLQVLSDTGFELVGLEPGFHDPADGTILQFDGFFRRA
ncbi:FkbM family methyltransferase [Actinomycetospora sp. CA-101289]|uniref:FkbM family methyltransferase n=1 Tax=Actinomycetospora sp. CA-101289 TaxID=3239893 RepID=UPI003D99B7D8